MHNPPASVAQDLHDGPVAGAGPDDAPAPSLLEPRRCRWCEEPLEGMAATAVYHGRKCRQAAWRFRHRLGDPSATAALSPGRFAYADPPFPGMSRKYYGKHPDYAGEVDHVALIASLVAGGYTGWALSTSSKALRYVLSLCPEHAHVCPWVKPIGVSSKTYGLHCTWEPLIVVGGRKRRPGIRDWLRAMPARGWGTLVGRKPVAFCAFLFDTMGMLPGDELADLFPGTGAVTRAWREVSLKYSDDGPSSTPGSDEPGAVVAS